MGLLSALFGAPLAPVRGVIWLAEQLEAQAAAEFSEPEAIRRQLADLARAFDRGEIDEDTYDAEEERLLRALPPLGSTAIGNPNLARET